MSHSRVKEDSAFKLYEREFSWRATYPQSITSIITHDAQPTTHPPVPIDQFHLNNAFP